MTTMDALARFVSGLVLAALILLAIALAVFGAGKVTQATLGVGLIALAIFVAVLARIAQAADHHAELRRWRDQDRGVVKLP